MGGTLIAPEKIADLLNACKARFTGEKVVGSTAGVT
jgi:hypothetical protein